MWERAETLGQRLLELDEDLTLEPDIATAPGLDEAQRELVESQADLAQLAEDARWWLQAGARLQWVPRIGADLAAPLAIVSAAESDILAARELLEAANGLVPLVPSSGDTVTTLVADQAELLNTAQQAKLHFRQAAQWLAQAEAWHEQLRADPPSARLNRRVIALAELHLQMVELAAWGESAADLLPQLVALAQQAQELRRRLGPGEAGSPAISALDLIQELRDLASRGRQSYQDTLLLLAEAPPRVTDSPLWPRLQDAEQVMGAVLQMGDAVLDAAQALEPALGLADDGGFSLLGGDTVRAVNALAGQQQALRDAAQAIDDAGANLAGVADRQGQIPFLGEANGLQDAVGELADALRLSSALFPVAAALLEDGALQQYLVLGHSADELRATGGYVSSLWLVTLSGGELVEVQYFDTVEVDDWSNLASYPTPPADLWEHMNAPVWLLRDVSWEPDFPTAARLAQEMFWIGQGIMVDGVIGINQWALGDLLSALGPVAIPGEEEFINADNFLPFLEQGKDSQGRAYLDIVLQGILDQLQRPAGLEELFDLATAARRVLDTKGVLLFLDDPDAERLLQQQSWAGSVYNGPGDHLLTVDSNVSWNKVDRNILRETAYLVDLSDPEAPQAQLTLTYTNQSGPTSGGCADQWQSMTRSGLYADLKEACYWNFLRIYVPESSTLLSGTPLPLPPGSISDTLGWAEVGDETLKTASENGTTVFSGLFNLDAGQTRQLRFDYRLAPAILERDGAFLTYTLMLQKQPGVQQRDTAVQVRLPQGYHIVASSQDPVATQGQVLSFAFPLTQDTGLQITMAAD